MKEETFDKLMIGLAALFIIAVIAYFGFKLGE